jgi:hypothetical protein
LAQKKVFEWKKKINQLGRGFTGLIDAAALAETMTPTIDI